MLIDQENGNVLAVLGEAVKGVFNGRVIGLCVDDEEVALRVWWCSDVL